MEKLDSLCTDIVEILIVEIEREKDKEQVSIKYGRLAEMLVPKMNPQNLNIPLGKVSDFCKEHTMPLLSSIVVNDRNYLPGPGYYEYYFPSAKSYEDQKRIFKEQRSCVANFDWSRLKELLGLD